MTQWLLARLREPSTWASLASFLAAAGIPVTEDVVRDVLLGAAGVAAALGVLLREKANA